MKQKVLVWDLPTRIFHWSLVILIPFMWFSADQGGSWMAWHLRAGLLILGLLLFRISWGFFGSDTSRFTQFIRGPQSMKSYLQGRLSENQQPGHNPVGALMVITLLLALLVQVITGLFSADENTYLYSGYLNSWVSSSTGTWFRTIHTEFFWWLVALITAHVVVVVSYKVFKKKNYITPMITGYKELPAPLPVLRFTSWRIAVVSIIFVMVLLVMIAYIG